MSRHDAQRLLGAFRDISLTARGDDKDLIPSLCEIAVIDPGYTGLPALPSVQFEGEASVSGKTYQIINPAYVPKQGDRVIMMPVGRTYVIVGPISLRLDSGLMTQTSNPGLITGLASATITSYQIRVINGFVNFHCIFATGTAITVPADGNILNTSLLQMDSTLTPSATAPNLQALAQGNTGQMSSWYIGTSGIIGMSATVPVVGSLPAGSVASVGGQYML